MLMNSHDKFAGTHKKTAAKRMNKVKLVGQSSTERRTRDFVEGIRKNRQKNHVKVNVDKIKRYATVCNIIEMIPCGTIL